MIKICRLFVITILFLMPNISELDAAVIDELSYVNEKSDFFTYINFGRIIKFLETKGVSISELNSLITGNQGGNTDAVIREFGLKLDDINEFILAMNSRDIEKNSGYIMFLNFRNNKGHIPESFNKNSKKLKSGTVYKISVEDDIYITRVNDFFAVGPVSYLESYLDRRSSGKPTTTGKGTAFKSRIGTKSVYLYLTVSDYLKDTVNSAINKGAAMSRGLKDNVFIQTLLSLEHLDWGIEFNDRIIFKSGLQGSKPEDSERLQMLCHTWIVGSSFAVSFADLMAAQSQSDKLNEVTSDQKLMSSIQKILGRIHVKQEDKGVLVSFEMTSDETDYMIAYINREIEKEKKSRAEKIEREKISKLTDAVNKGNTELITRYIKEKYNLNGIDTDGNTPLSAAASTGNIKIAKLLIENGAGLNTFNIDKIAPIHEAVRTEKREMVIYLLNAGCDVNLKGDSDLTPLHYNAMQGNSEITNILISKGADVNSLDSGSSSPMHYAASGGFMPIVKILVEKNANPEIVNRDQLRAIDVAAHNGQNEVVNYLKEKFKQEPKTVKDEEFNLDDEYKSGDKNSSDPEFDESEE